jgi:MFS family permease
MNIALFKAFDSRNYRLYFWGQAVSLVGTWIQRTAVYWVIYIHTHSTFMLGVGVFASQFPSFLLSAFGGLVSDRYNRYRVLLITQTASMVQAALLALMVIYTNYNVWEVLCFSSLLGIINAFNVPVRQSLVYELVDRKEDLGNAIALNSTMINLAGLIGPAIAGFVLQGFGVGLCFLLNSLSFIAVIISLWSMNLPAFVPKPITQNVTEGLKEGWRYLKQTPSIARVILLLSCTSLFVLPYFTLLPVYAKEILHGNASTFGYLNSITGLGALLGAVFLASLRQGKNLDRILIFMTIVFGLGLALFAYTVNLYFSLLFAAVAGFGMMAQTTLVNTIIQTRVSAGMRGRVISYYAMAFFGMQPVGALIIGSISHYLHAQATMLFQGLIALVIAIFFVPYLWKEFKRSPDPEDNLPASVKE